MSQVKLLQPVDLEVQILPDDETRLETEHHVERFVRERLSGQVTIVLNFSKGTRLPSEVAMRRLQVGREKTERSKGA